MEIASLHIVHVHSAVLQIVGCIKQQIADEHFQKIRCGMNALLQVVIVGTNQCVLEIPGVLLKSVVVHLESEGLHILDQKHRDRPGVTLAEGVDLPDILFAIVVQFAVRV